MKNHRVAGLLCAFFATMCRAGNYPVYRLIFNCSDRGDTPKRTSGIQAKNGVQVFFSAPCPYQREFKLFLCKYK